MILWYISIIHKKEKRSRNICISDALSSFSRVSAMHFFGKECPSTQKILKLCLYETNEDGGVCIHALAFYPVLQQTPWSIPPYLCSLTAPTYDFQLPISITLSHSACILKPLSLNDPLFSLGLPVPGTSFHNMSVMLPPYCFSVYL